MSFATNDIFTYIREEPLTVINGAFTFQNALQLTVDLFWRCLQSYKINLILNGNLVIFNNFKL